MKGEGLPAGGTIFSRHVLNAFYCRKVGFSSFFFGGGDGVLEINTVIQGTGRGLTTQVPDQWIFTGVTPEWSDSEGPAKKVTGGLPVINWLVLGLPFFHRYFSLPPY